MGPIATSRAGVFIVRVWVEGDSQALRARITEVDLTTGDEVSRTSSRIEDICTIARAFLERFVGDGGVTDG